MLSSDQTSIPLVLQAVFYVYFHPQMRCGRVLRCIRLSVCLSVRGALPFESFDLEKFIFDMQVQLQNRQVTFVQQGHWVKVKVTGEIRACLCVANICDLKQR